MFKIKHFNDLSSNDMYEIAKARYEVFACEQKITSENDFDDVDKECFHVFKEDNGNIIASLIISYNKFTQESCPAIE